MKTKYIVNLRKESADIIYIAADTTKELQEELKTAIQSTDEEITVNSVKTIDIDNHYQLNSDLLIADFDNFEEMVMEFIDLVTDGHEDLEIWALN